MCSGKVGDTSDAARGVESNRRLPHAIKA